MTKHILSEEPLTERQQGIEEGYQAALNDAESGLLKGAGIYTTAQVCDFVDLYRTAIRQTITNDIRGVYRLGSGAGDEDRLADKLIKEADAKFSGLLRPADQKAER